MIQNNRSTLEEAVQVCEAAHCTLLNYAGVMQRVKSTVRCNLCEHEFNIVVGGFKNGRKCPNCKGTGHSTRIRVDPLFTEDEIIALKEIAQQHLETCQRDTTTSQAMRDIKECRQQAEEAREQSRIFHQKHLW